MECRLNAPSPAPMPAPLAAPPLPLASAPQPLAASASALQALAAPPPAPAPAPQPTLTWMQQSDWQRYETLGDAGIGRRRGKRVLSALEKEADARRKRVRRINTDKEDRDALRELARKRSDGTQLELEPTPPGIRQSAIEGSPRSAKAAGAKLRKLTQTFYARLRDSYSYGVTEKQLRHVEVKTTICESDFGHHPTTWLGNHSFGDGLRRLKPYGLYGLNHTRGPYRLKPQQQILLTDEHGRINGFRSMSAFLSESETESDSDEA
jgi:hypothetical protein